jgi:hypothetical protein
MPTGARTDGLRGYTAMDAAGPRRHALGTPGRPGRALWPQRPQTWQCDGRPYGSGFTSDAKRVPVAGKATWRPQTACSGQNVRRGACHDCSVWPLCAPLWPANWHFLLGLPFSDRLRELAGCQPGYVINEALRRVENCLVQRKSDQGAVRHGHRQARLQAQSIDGGTIF